MINYILNTMTNDKLYSKYNDKMINYILTRSSIIIFNSIKDYAESK